MPVSQRERDVSAAHLERLSQVYSPRTWDVYAELDRTLDPRGPDWLVQRAAGYLTSGARVLDAGCRDGSYLIRLVRGRAVTGVGIDPVALHVERARAAVAEMHLQGQVTIVQGVMDDAAQLGQEFDLIWCRDVLEQVADLAAALAGVAQVLSRRGRMIVFTTVATDLLEPRERMMLGRHMGNVMSNLSEATIEASFAGAGLVIEDKDIIGTEWREYAEERTQPVATALLRLARLHRARDSITGRVGQDIYNHIEANLHWELFQFLGKLRPTVYVLRRP